MNDIPDLTDVELWGLQSTVNERWKDPQVQLELADVELQLGKKSSELTSCPAVFWFVKNCNFVVVKMGSRRFRCHFLYDKDLDQYGTGITEFDDIAKCIVTLLHTQADDESVRSGAFSEEHKPKD